MAHGFGRRPISSEPLINRIHAHRDFISILAVTIFILYATGLPTPGIVPAEPPGAPSRQDLVQNIVLYVPLGLVLSLAGKRRRLSGPANLMMTLAGATLLSATAEFAQQFLPGRHAAAHDILMNTTGAGIGGVSAAVLHIGARGWRRRWREGLTHQPLFLTFLAALALFVLSSLGPFQLDATPRPERTLLNPARLAAWTARPAAEAASARQRCEHLLDLAATVGGFAAIGFLACTSLQSEFGFRRLTSGLLAGWMIAGTAVAVVLLQMFIPPRGFDAGVVPASLVGGAIGMLATWGATARARCSATPGAAWLWAAAGLTMILIVVRELVPFALNLNAEHLATRAGQINWIPFRRYFSGSGPATASSDVLAKLTRFFVFGALLNVALAQRPLQARLGAAAGHTLALATALEIVQLGVAERSVDLTHVLLGVCGVLCGMIAMQWWLDVIASHRRPQQPDAPPR